MNFTDYNTYFKSIVTQENPTAPYNDPMYMDYTKLNNKRSSRWMKHGEILPELKSLVENIKTPQNWLLITEPWCGDAAHTVPFIHLLSELSEKITVEIQLRDSDSEIDNYLTDGGKSIPKLIIRDTDNKDLIIWGPRPVDCQKVFDQLKTKEADFEQQKIALQNWYNEDKGVSFQRELLEQFKNISL